MKNIILTISFIITFAISHNGYSTNVSGGIYANTTWTLINSPYIVTDTVVVFPGVTLTIEPGVVVKFDTNTVIEIRQANIIAIGTSIDSITFTSNLTAPYQGIYLNQALNSKFNYCTFRYAITAIDNISVDTFIIKNSSFSYCFEGIGCGISSAGICLIDSCNFSNNSYYGIVMSRGDLINSRFLDNYIGIQVGDWLANIENCVVDSNHIGINNIMNTYINSCTINNNQIGVSSFEGGNTIKNCIINYNNIEGINAMSSFDSLIHCQIKYNGIGLNDTFPNISSTYHPIITRNQIDSNVVGIKLNSSGDSIYCNHICGNSSYDVYYMLGFNSNVNIGDNYWCTIDSSIVASHVYDGYDNINYGLALFMPIDTVGCYITPYSACNLIVSATVINASCGTCADGSATAVIANGLAPYVYTWYTIPIQSTATATGLAPSTYTLCVSDANGCTACNNSIFVDSSNCIGFSDTLIATNTSCSFCSDGFAAPVIYGGTPPYSYTWYTSPIQTTDTAINLTPGTYHVCISDFYGCVICDSVIIGISHCSAFFNLYPDSIPHHYNLVYVSSGVPPLSYDWNWGDSSPHDTIPYPSHTYASPGTYTICLTIVDSAGCTNTYCSSYYLMRTSNTMIFVNVLNTTGINEIVKSNKISVFPNPAKATLNIHQSFTSPNELVIITDILGHEVYKAPLTGIDNTINLTKWSNGVYFYEVKSEKESIRGKFIKE